MRREQYLVAKKKIMELKLALTHAPLAQIQKIQKQVNEMYGENSDDVPPLHIESHVPNKEESSDSISERLVT